MLTASVKSIAGAWSSIPPDGHEIGFQLNEQAICEYSWTAGAFGDGHPADFNNDGFVNVTDLLELLAAWDGCP